MSPEYTITHVAMTNGVDLSLNSHGQAILAHAQHQLRKGLLVQIVLIFDAFLPTQFSWGPACTGQLVPACQQ